LLSGWKEKSHNKNGERELMTKDQRRLRANSFQGAWGGLYGTQRAIIDGYHVERTGIGSDVHVTKVDLGGNVVEDKLVDFKTGGAVLSEKQMKCGAEAVHVWVPPFARHFPAPRFK